MNEKTNLGVIYNSIKDKMCETISHITYVTYIENLMPVEMDGRFIVLDAPSESCANFIRNTLAGKIRAAIINADVGLSDFRLKIRGNYINKICVKCGIELLPRWKFCPECGRKIN